MLPESHHSLSSRTQVRLKHYNIIKSILQLPELKIFNDHTSVWMKSEESFPVSMKKSTNLQTRCTQKEQNARLHVTSLSSDRKYCKEDNKIKPNM